MLRVFLVATSLALMLGVHAAEPEYPHDITMWQEAAMPLESPKEARKVWLYLAKSSRLKWRVFNDDGKPSAMHGQQALAKRPNSPNFTPIGGEFRKASAFVAVEDGWLVGFSHGEFGGALYWFSQDGKRSYKVTDHQVQDFASLPDGVYAIEGLAHGDISEGSVIRISRPKGNARWKATTVAKLPFAPYALSLRRDGTMLITLSNSLVSLGPDRKIHTLLANAPWRGLYPNSSIISTDQRTLYIGMLQFVGELDLTTSKFRFLIPSNKFLNKLPIEDQERIRKY